MCVTLNWVVTHLVLTQVNTTRGYVCSRFYLHDPLPVRTAHSCHILTSLPRKRRRNASLPKQGPNLPLGVHYHIGSQRYHNGLHSPNSYVPCVPSLIDFNLSRLVSSIEALQTGDSIQEGASPRPLCYCPFLSYIFGCSVCRVGGSASSSSPSCPSLQVQSLPSSSFHPPLPAPLLPVGPDIRAEARD